MDLTSWLEYFVEGLATQLAEVRTRGERAIRQDVLIKERGLSDRQAKALSRIVEYGSLTIKEFRAPLSRGQSPITAARRSGHDRTGDRGRSNQSDRPPQAIRVQGEVTGLRAVTSCDVEL